MIGLPHEFLDRTGMPRITHSEWAERDLKETKDLSNQIEELIGAAKKARKPKAQ